MASQKEGKKRGKGEKEKKDKLVCPSGSQPRWRPVENASLSEEEKKGRGKKEKKKEKPTAQERAQQIRRFH